MKKYLISVITFIVLLFNNSCEDIDLIHENSFVGTWRITSFVMDGNDITNLFDGYIITCEEDGCMVISGNGNTYFCDWDWNNASHTECNIQIHNCDIHSIIMQLNNVWNLTDHSENICIFESKASMHHNRMFWTRTE